jgi:hypothetical protein
VARTDIEELRRAMRVAEAALDGGTGTRAAWTKASVDYYLAIHPDEARWRPTGAEEGIPSVEQIRERALVADRANKALRGTSRVDPDPERHDEWSARLGWFDETLSAVFTDEFLAAVAAVKGGDQAGLEYVVRFLEADPWCRRSGYMKASLIPAIARLELNELTRRRLARVVLTVVDDPRHRREIRRYGALARAVATPGLRRSLEERAVSGDPQIQFNARQVLEVTG